MPRPSKDITGQTFHKLTAIKLLRTEQVGWSDGRNRTFAVWLWKCECGKHIESQARYVCRGFKKSCGCHVRRGRMALAYHVYCKYNDGDLQFDDFMKLTQMPCSYCGAEPSNCAKKNNHEFKYNGLDRIDNSKGHDLDNIVPACWRCNEMKKARHRDDFLNHIETIMLQQFKNEIEGKYGK